MSFLEIRELTFTYPGSEEKALDGIDLDADRGQIIAVIGPNAAGKSTFALVLKGLLKPGNGKIWIDGVCREAPGPDPGVGILFSNPENQLVTSIVEEDIAFGLEVLGENPRVIQEKVGSVLSRLGIENLRNRMPHLLSGGEQQMAALAGVLVLDPDIIVLDEPTTYLDPDARVFVLAFMRHLADQGQIVFLITHDMKEAAIADRILLLDQGRLALNGSPEEVFGQPELQQLDILPPFLSRMAAGLKKMGITERPEDPAALAAAVINHMAGKPGTRSQGLKTSPSEDMRSSALAYEQVWFRYDGNPQGGAAVLKGLDYKVGRGSMALVCGANGSGKSTMLQMSNGLVDPDKGQVLLGGQQLKTFRKRRGGVAGHVALLFQNPERQLFSATVFDDIAFGPRNMGLSSKIVAQRVANAARWAGVPDSLMDRPVFTLSGGQMRRVAVAGSLAMEADVLVLDEPTDGLDPGSTREFYDGARRYCIETGATVLVAAHAIPEEVACFDHLAHLAGGIIQSSGSPPGLLAGKLRTLPRQFLPDHLVTMEELLKSGVPVPEGVLDAAGTGKFILELLEKKSV